MSGVNHPNAVPDNEIRSSRLISAPRELVWTALADPNHLRHWWGPKGFTNTFHIFDFKVGGTWKFIMHGPDGRDYPNDSRFVEITKPSRLVFDHVCAPLFRMIITLEARGVQTEIVWRQVFKSAEECTKVKVYAGPANEENFDRLEERLRGMSHDQSEFVISREFDAPRELVWKAWTDPEHLKKWFGPKGYVMPTCKMDFRVGGVFHYGLRSPDGTAIWGKWVFREITPPDRLVLVSSFSDEKMGLTRHPFAPEWPIQILSTTTFTPRGNKTELTIQWRPLNPTEIELKTFIDRRASMHGGWTGTFDQLEAHLATQTGK